ncbi:hypothetical protein D8I24_8082 [Cupriavidus necator H850]|nr:hypothetical protein D8I24_8082 [Cupriavidus necator H850]
MGRRVEDRGRGRRRHWRGSSAGRGVGQRKAASAAEFRGCSGLFATLWAGSAKPCPACLTEVGSRKVRETATGAAHFASWPSLVAWTVLNTIRGGIDGDGKAVLPDDSASRLLQAK